MLHIAAIEKVGTGLENFLNFLLTVLTVATLLHSYPAIVGRTPSFLPPPNSWLHPQILALRIVAKPIQLVAWLLLT